MSNDNENGTIPIARKLTTEADLVFSINGQRRNSQDALFEEPVSQTLSEQDVESSNMTESTVEGENEDTIDQAFMAMGGFGKFQKFSYVMNTLTQGAAAFFVYCFVFLEKHPIYECMDKLNGTWKECDREHFCESGSKITWRVDWENNGSIHNLIEQLNFYCKPDFMIGLVGAFFLLGIVIGCSTLTRLGDVYGRKPIYILGIAMHLSFMCGILISRNAFLDYFLLFEFGMSITARYYVGYTYNLEMQPKSHYVLVSTTMFLFESCVYIFICCYFAYISDQWKYLQIPNICLSLMGITCLSFMPESPRFLISRMKFKEARDIFKFIGKINGISDKDVAQRLNDITFDNEPRKRQAVRKSIQFEGDSSFNSDITTGSINSSSQDIKEDIKVGPEINTDNLQSLNKPDRDMRRQLRSQRKQRRLEYGASFNHAKEEKEVTFTSTFMSRLGMTNKHSNSFAQPTNTFNMQASFVGPMAAQVGGNDPIISKQKDPSVWEIIADPVLKKNLWASCFTWLLSAFNFYLITFYLKNIPGSVYLNSVLFALADMCAFLSSGIILKFLKIHQGLTISYGLSLIGGICYLIFYDTDLPWVIPVLLCVRYGGAMSFNIGYVSVARLFPTKFVATVFGLVNLVANFFTIAAPMVAEMKAPIPFVWFCFNTIFGLFFCNQLVELGQEKKIESIEDKNGKKEKLIEPSDQTL